MGTIQLERDELAYHQSSGFESGLEWKRTYGTDEYEVHANLFSALVSSALQCSFDFPLLPEQANRQHDRSCHAHPHSSFRHTFAVIFCYSLQVIALLKEVQRCSDHRSQRKSQE